MKEVVDRSADKFFSLPLPLLLKKAGISHKDNKALYINDSTLSNHPINLTRNITDLLKYKDRMFTTNQTKMNKGEIKLKF